MSKVICDVCGTAYPETAAQCPICGSARSEQEPAAAGDPVPGSEGKATYTYVKGGRFSKANVRKRNRSAGLVPQREPEPEEPDHKDDQDDRDDQNDRGSNRWLVALTIVLLLAIVAVIVYICLQVFGPGSQQQTPGPGSTPNPSSSSDATETIPCTGLNMEDAEVNLLSQGSTWMLTVRPSPANTTQPLVFRSSDTSVATVDQTGKVTAVGKGEAIISVTCGNMLAECKVKCMMGAQPEPTTEPTTEPTEPSTEPTEPSTEPTEPPTEPQPKLELKDPQDFTLSRKGYSFQLYSGPLDRTQITWSSDNPEVATVENGRVTAVGIGRTIIRASWNGETATCIIRCRWEEEPEGPGEETTAPTTGTEKTYRINKTDVTIAVGGAFNLTLSDENGVTVPVTWTADKPGICAINGNWINGLSVGRTVVSATVDGQTYSCIVRVKAAS